MIINVKREQLHSIVGALSSCVVPEIINMSRHQCGCSKSDLDLLKGFIDLVHKSKYKVNERMHNMIADCWSIIRNQSKEESK